MRVAYVCADPGIPVWGNKGCSIHVQAIIRALLRDAVEVDLVALRTGGDRPTGLESVAFHIVGVEQTSTPHDRERVCKDLNHRIRELLTAIGPFDAVYERHALWSYAGVEHARDEGIPGLLEVNSLLVEEQATHRVLVDRDGAVDATRRAFHAASAIMPVSQEVADYVRSFAVQRDRVHLLPNAVDPESFIGCRLSRDASSDSTFTIGFVGSLKPWHGVDRLIAAYEQLWAFGTNWHLRIVGDGPHRQNLELLADALPKQIATSIEFVGMVPHADIPAALGTFHVAVAPGVSGEAYFSPLKVFEYMAAGLPIVAARLGQLPTIIEHGITGLLYDPDDTADLAALLLRVRDNPQTAARMGEAAQQSVITNHTWDQRRNSILRIVQSCTPAQVQSVN